MATRILHGMDSIVRGPPKIIPVKFSDNSLSGLKQIVDWRRTTDIIGSQKLTLVLWLRCTKNQMWFEIFYVLYVRTPFASFKN